MPSATDHPSSESSPAEWTAVGSSATGAVSSNDGDTSYMYMSFGTKYHRYVMPDLPGTASAVSSVGEYAYRKVAADVGVYDFGVAYNKATAYSSAGCSTSYALTGAAWGSYLTVADVNAGDSGIIGYDTAGGEVRCTELYRTTVYVEGGDFFVSIYSWLGPALWGANITLKDLFRANALSATLHRPVKNGIRRIIWDREEINRAWQDLKNGGYKFPAYSIG